MSKTVAIPEIMYIEGYEEGFFRGKERGVEKFLVLSMH